MSIAAIRRWSRSSSTRFTLLFLLLFGATSGGLFAFVYYRSIAYFNAQTDEWLTRETVRLLAPDIDRADALQRVASHNRHDIEHVRVFALFDAAQRHLAGDIGALPAAFPVDTAVEFDAQTGRGIVPLRAMARRLRNGDLFIASQDLRQTRRFAAELVRAMEWAAIAMLLLGVAGAAALGAAQQRRVRDLATGLRLIVAGKLGARLPISPWRDELDDLTDEVNAMLGEIQRLMEEVKSAGDNIAHDLRTPLTRLLSRLQQAQTASAGPDSMAAAIADAVTETQAIIATFNALLRIAEIDEGARRQCFRLLDLSRVVEDVADFHEVAALERGIVIERELPAALPFEGDPDLLFEAVGNLVDNAVKYTPAGGRIAISLAPGPVLRVADNGPGIPPDLRDRVIRRFQRLEASRSQPGNGLGLALVSAIARLHRLDLRLSGERGCVATLSAA